MKEQRPSKFPKGASTGNRKSSSTSKNKITGGEKERSFTGKKDPKTDFKGKRPAYKAAPSKGRPGAVNRFDPKAEDGVIPQRVTIRGEAAPPKRSTVRPGPGGRARKPEKKEYSTTTGSRPARDKAEADTAPRPRNFTREKPGERKITYGKNTRELNPKNIKTDSEPLSGDTNDSLKEEAVNNYIYGRHPVLESLKNGTSINKVWIGEYTRDTSEFVEQMKERGIPYKIVPKNKLNDLVGDGANHQGVVAEAAGRDYSELEELVALCKTKTTFFIILDKVEDPHNLGAIIRTADAAGVDGIIIPKHKAVGLTGVVAKTAAGALDRMRVCRVANLGQAMDLLKENNVWTVGVDMDGKEDYSKANLKGAVALVLGGEGQGLSRLLKEKCDFIVKIPMQSAANSLNVSVATAIMIYEVFRQKDFK